MTKERPLSIEVTPGKHNLSYSTKHEPDTVVVVAPNETAYVEMIISTGTWRGGGRLITVDSEQAETKVRKLEPISEQE